VFERLPANPGHCWDEYSQRRECLGEVTLAEDSTLFLVPLCTRVHRLHLAYKQLSACKDCPLSMNDAGEKVIERTLSNFPDQGAVLDWWEINQTMAGSRSRWTGTESARPAYPEKKKKVPPP